MTPPSRFGLPRSPLSPLATTQNNRANLLRNLAALADEPRRDRLDQALAAYDAALLIWTPEIAPFDFATTQNNRANLLHDLAALADEPHHDRLGEALHAAWSALVIFETMGHMSHTATARWTLQVIQQTCGADFEELWKSLDAGPCPHWLSDLPRPSIEEAVFAFINAQSPKDMEQLVGQFPRIATEEIEPIFARLMDEHTGNPRVMEQLSQRRALLRACREQGAAAVFAQLRTRLPDPDIQTQLIDPLFAFINARSLDDLERCVAQHPRLATEDVEPIFEQLLTQYADNTNATDDLQRKRSLLRACREQGAAAVFAQLRPGLPDPTPQAQLIDPLFAFINARSLDDLERCVAQHPRLATEEIEPIFVQLLEQHTDHPENVEQLTQRRALLRACREQGAVAVFGSLVFSRRLAEYQAVKQTAVEGKTATAEQWQQAATQGEALLDPRFAELPHINRQALHADLAGTYNMLGNAVEQHDQATALAAYERAIALQPEFAMWRRNRAGTLIKLGRLAEAAAGDRRRRGGLSRRPSGSRSWRLSL